MFQINSQPNQPASQNAFTRVTSGLRQAARFGLVLLLALGMNLTSLAFSASPTAAYYADSEQSVGNTFRAQMLDFDITNNERSGYIGLEADGDIDDFSSIVTQNSNSLDVQYSVQSELAGGEVGFCEALGFEINHLGTDFSDEDAADHSILDVTRSTTTVMGTWEFKDLDLNNSAAQFAHGTECNIDLVFTGWRDGVDTPTASGYTDKERVSLKLKNRMIVMNEFLPNPDPSAHGLDYGNDSDDKPGGEWIEIYNNSLEPHDLSGWYFEDDAGNTIDVTASNTDPATTTVPARGWLVVYMNQAVLNNSGDTIMLKNNNDTTIDEYTYDGGDYCENEPTPNATNTASMSGDCSDVPPNKSYARIPDGIGAWVDPIPTPGGRNTLLQPQASSTSDVAGTSTHSTSSGQAELSTGTSTQATSSGQAQLSTDNSTSTVMGTSTESDTSTTTNTSAGTSTATTTSDTADTDAVATSTEEAASSTQKSTGSSGGENNDDNTPNVSTSTDVAASSSTASSTTETASSTATTSSENTLENQGENASGTASSSLESDTGTTTEDVSGASEHDKKTEDDSASDDSDNQDEEAGKDENDDQKEEDKEVSEGAKEKEESVNESGESKKETVSEEEKKTEESESGTSKDDGQDSGDGGDTENQNEVDGEGDESSDDNSNNNE